jgi:hypothetical protein
MDRLLLRVALACVLTACECDGGAAPIGDAAAGDGGACAAELVCRSGALCCAAGEECVDDVFCLSICANARCGDNGSLCCDAGEVCLDGVLCAAACAAGEAVCGAELGTCCEVGQACVDDACVTPGMPCGDDYDCLGENEYCELTIGRCLPIPDVTPVCEVMPDFAEVELEVEWHWTGVDAGALRYDQVAATAAVGDVSGDGIPDVVVPAYRTGEDAILVALSGADGTLLWRIGPGPDDPDWLSPPAVGDLDGDPVLEIVYTLQGGGVRIVDGDGLTELGRRMTGGARVPRSAPSIADLDGDGTADVIVGCHAMNGIDISDPAMDFFDRGECRSPVQTFASTVVADLDGDGTLDVTSGGAAYRIGALPADQVLWERPTLPHGLAAVADLDVDGDPEVIRVRAGSVIVLEGATGAVLVGPGGTWQDGTFAIPGGGSGGAPTVADFDGDGLPEFATAGQGAYAVYDPDCLVTPPRAGGDCAPGTTNLLRWQAPTQDVSSSVTGSSVFDFQGDGVAEVVYNDECFLHVYDGRDGSAVLAMPYPNSSRTALEYPAVVDVDRDGNSEIVLPANRDQIARDMCQSAWSAALGIPIAELPAEFRDGTSGLFVLGDPGDRWVRTRPIWNQFAYHVTNVGDLGEIPATEVDNWSVPALNNYRTNVQGKGVFNAPNLVVTLEAIARCADSDIRLSAVVRNAGSRGVAAGVQVEFVRTGPGAETSIATTATTRPLLSGESERVTVIAEDVMPDVDFTFEVRVDGPDATAPVLECNEDDNQAQAAERCPSFG